MLHTRWCDLLGIEVPVVCAPMGGMGCTTGSCVDLAPPLRLCIEDINALGCVAPYATPQLRQKRNGAGMKLTREPGRRDPGAGRERDRPREPVPEPLAHGPGQRVEPVGGQPLEQACVIGARPWGATL